MEVLIVVIILGVLASVIIAQVTNASEDSKQVGFASQLKSFVKAEGVYRLRTGQYLTDASSGVCPPGFDQYIPREAWEGGTPVGGVWDSELNDHGVVSAIGVHFDGSGVTRNNAYMQQIDALLDDGNLATGAFRRLAPLRYYWVVAD